MKFLYESDRDAEAKLYRSVIIHNGAPYLVSSARASNCVLDPLIDGPSIEVPTCELDLTPCPTGNVVCGDTYCFTTRVPRRMWKQGLCNDNLHKYTMPFDDPKVRKPGVDVRSTNYGRTILGDYPKAVDAIEDVAAGRKLAVPFSREFGIGCVEGIPSLIYRDKRVGFVSDGVTLFGKFFFLKEKLLKELNRGLEA